MTLILLIIVIIVLFGGGFYGYRSGYVGPGYGYGNPFGLFLLVIVLLLVFGAFGGPRLGWW